MSTPAIEMEDKADARHLEGLDGNFKQPNLLVDEYVPGTEAEKKLLRKLDLRLLPCLWVMYVFNFLDRTNIGNAKTGGMQADLNLSSNGYSLILSIFFVGYLLFEVPSNMILAKSKPSVFLPTIMFVWGCVSIAVKGVNNIGGMIAIRLALGILESGYFPGVMLLMSCWYKPLELSKRIAFFYTATLMAGAFGGLLAGGIITGMEGVAGVRGWKWLFLIEGMGTVVVAAAAYFILPDFPMQTKWLTDEEKRLAVIRLEIREDLAEPMSSKQAFMTAVKNPLTWLFMLAYNVLTITGTASYFFPTLMASLGYTGNMVQFMTVPIYIVALVISMAMSFSADRTGKKGYHVMAACLWGTISFVICVATKNFKVRYAFICFGASGVWTGIPLFLSWFVTMFEGRESRAVSIALINGLGNLASIYGSFIWPATDAPYYSVGFGVIAAAMGISFLVAIAVKWRYGDTGYQNIPRRGRSEEVAA